MSIVTALKPQKNKKRVNVYLDNEFAFGIDLDNLVRFGIKIEKEFTSHEIKKIIHEAEFAKTYNKLLNFVTLRPRSEQEIANWFKRKEVPDSLTKNLKLKIKNLGFLDDEKFAKWWVEQRKEYKFKSKKEINYELRKKGIDKNIISKVLAESEIDEEKMARELFEKNKRKWLKYDTKKQKEKAFQFLARRGFDYETIKNVVQYTQGE